MEEKKTTGSHRPPEAGLLDRVAEFYHKTLFNTDAGLECLRRIGLAESDLLDTHQVGYCNDSLKGTLPDAGPVLGQLHDLGILTEQDREHFLGNLVFPVHDSDGNLATLAGYSIETDLSKASATTLPGAAPGIWNSHVCRAHTHVLMTGSIVEAMCLEAAGLSHVCAAYRPLTQEDLDLLSELGVSEIILTGTNDMRAQLSGRLDRFACRIKSTGKTTISELLCQKGPEKLGQHIDAIDEQPVDLAAKQIEKPKSPSLEEFPDGFSVRLSGRCYEVRGLQKGPGKLRAAVRVEHRGRLHVDTLNLYAARARRSLCEDLSRIFEKGALEIQSDMAKLIKLCEGYRKPRANESGLPLLTMMTHEEKEEALAFGRDPNLLDRILTDYDACGLIGERVNKQLSYLAAVSRKLPDPISVLILSSSGAGKSSLQDTTLRLCPPEDVVKLTRLSGRALFYKAKGSLKHKILALEEEVGAEDAVYAIRNLISAKELTIESTVKDLGTGRMTTMQNRVEGPTAVFVTTTNPDVDPETRSRFFVTSVDESRGQTRAILAYQRRRQSGELDVSDAQLSRIIRRHHNFQRLLVPVRVVNRFAGRLVYDDDRLQSRRDQPMYLGLIGAVAFLHQMGREQYSETGQVPHIRVTEKDIEIANNLACEVLGRSLSDLNRVSCELLHLIETLVEERITEARQALVEKGDPVPVRSEVLFTRRDIREFTGWPHSRVVRYLKQLVDFEYVIKKSGTGGTIHRYYLAYNGQGNDGERFVMGFRPIRSAAEGDDL